MKKSMAAALAAIVLAGCVTTAGKVVDTQAMSTFKPGVTTITEVKAEFGEPFLETREPDGTDQLQYMSKVRMRDQSTDHTTGSNIPRQIEKNISSMLVFDQKGRFVHAWTGIRPWTKTYPAIWGTCSTTM
jgi:outer membrane protein assembly factor BamE (lipoprotein component of BamABCDE complex)